MSHPVNTAPDPSDLRLRAAMQLGGRAAPGRAGDALAVLHALASSPATAADALALLHELQVHQVELDLQAEELRESRSELESALRRQIELYDSQPVGCYTIDAASVVREVNLAGARMLGIARDEAYGLPLESFLAPNSARALRQLIARIGASRTSETSTLPLSMKDDADRVVCAHVSADPAGSCFLVVLAS